MVQKLKNWTTLNTSHDFWEDSEFVHQINVALLDIFCRMNSLWNWFYSNKEEEISTSDWKPTNKFKTEYGISRVWQVKWDGKILTPSNVNFNLDNPEWNEEWEGDYYLSWENEIKTKGSYTKLDIIYCRFPKWHNYDNLNEDIDLPNGLMGALEFLIYWRIMPVFYEQWASLANNYLAQFKEHLDNYAANVGFLTNQKGFIN